MWKNVQEQEYPSESHEFEHSVIDDDCGTAAIKLCGLGGQVSHEDPEADLLRWTGYHQGAYWYGGQPGTGLGGGEGGAQYQG